MTDPSIGQGSAHGKIILLGEHSVVYNKPSIAIPFPAAKVTARVEKALSATRIDCDFYHGLLDNMPELLESLKATIRVSLEYLKKQDNYLHITIDSDIPAERGMGSSAAVSVATTRGIFDYFKTPLSQEKLLEIVEVAETIAHGNPSGLDALMTSSESPCYFVKGQPFQKLALNLDTYLVVGDTGITGQTKEAVESIAENLVGTEQYLVKTALDDLGLLADKGREFLESNQGFKLGIVMTRVHQILDILGVSSPELNHLVLTALKHQALGAKLTGGGRGGCMIALASNKESAETISLALKEAGAKQTWIYEMRGQ